MTEALTTPAGFSNKSLAALAEEFPNLQVTITLSDLMKANRELVAMTMQQQKKQLEEQEKEEEYPTIDETCKLLNVVKSTLWRWQKTGYLVPIKICGKNRYRKSDIMRIFEQKNNVG